MMLKGKPSFLKVGAARRAFLASVCPAPSSPPCLSASILPISPFLQTFRIPPFLFLSDSVALIL